MSPYEQQAMMELQRWLKQMRRNPSIMGRVTDGVQSKINSYIPEKVHKAITVAIKEMVKAVLTGSKYITAEPAQQLPLEEIELKANKRIDFYKKTAAAEGGITGAGGFLMSLADFPILLGLKIKLLFDIAAIYGKDVHDYRERIYILYIFQLAFSTQKERKQLVEKLVTFEEGLHQLPVHINDFDWRTFQQQYRDYIDLAKLAQLIPFIGAAVGFVANYKLMTKLGKTAIQAYRLRRFNTTIEYK